MPRWPNRSVVYVIKNLLNIANTAARSAHAVDTMETQHLFASYTPLLIVKSSVIYELFSTHICNCHEPISLLQIVDLRSKLNIAL